MLPFNLALRFLAALVVVLVGLLSPSRNAEPLSAVERKEAIDRLVDALQSSYVFPEMAEKMSASIREHLGKGRYEKVEDAELFAKMLTEDLQAVSHDKHLRVRLQGPPAAGSAPRRRFPESEEEFRRLNFGFEKIERLPGNIGYIDLRMFAPAGLAGETARAAMDFLANTDALVIDLRENGGGQPEMVQLFCSYLFDAEPVHLNDLYFRPADETRQFWTLPWIPGRRYLDKDVYVLTSKLTFSGAEECAYNLKTQKRARIVGETSGGGAHPGGMVDLTQRFAVFVPTGRAINPITGTDWEGTGVEPDVAVAAKLALGTAHTLALQKLIDGCQDAERRAALTDALERVKQSLALAQAEKSDVEPATAERRK